MTPRERPENDAMTAVLARAETDAVFRQQLLVDPRQVIYDTFGIRIPDEFRLRFIERHPDVDALVVLPDLQVERAELSDLDLEQVVGGAGAHDSHRAWKSAASPRSSRRHTL